MSKLSYRYTKTAAYLGYVTQAIVNNLGPLLFVTFSKEFGLSLDKLSLLITVNFGVQIATDLLSAKYIMKLGYRPSCVVAHVIAALGLVFYGILPKVMSPFIGLIIATVFNAVGGGLDEVIISPVMEAIPGDSKASDMSLLHSFYCWGQMAVVLGSTLYFTVVGIEHWTWLPVIWAIVPAVTAVMFLFVPIRELSDHEEDISIGSILSQKAFWILFVIMLCAGASELGMSQWASLFAERGLGVPKAIGDLLGPCLFAAFMGVSRLIFGIAGSKLNLEKCMVGSGVLCVAGYLIAALVGNPIIALMGCGLCGFSVGLMWPGTYSICSGYIPDTSAKLFALLAFAGDIGCTSGPDVVGLVGNYSGDIRKGLLFGIIFPIVLAVSVILLRNEKKNKAA